MSVLGERIRAGEYMGRDEIPDVWTIVRVDGRGFSKLTAEHFEKPASPTFAHYMREVGEALMTTFGGIYAYTQSDEVSVLLPPDFDLFDRRLLKVTSVAAGVAAARFTKVSGVEAGFDARVWCGREIKDIAEYFTWRTADAYRNAISTRAYWTLRKQGVSYRQVTTRLSRLGQRGREDIIRQAGVAVEDLPRWERFGADARWEDQPHTGVDPRDGTEHPTTRRRIVWNMNLSRESRSATFEAAIRAATA